MCWCVCVCPFSPQGDGVCSYPDTQQGHHAATPYSAPVYPTAPEEVGYPSPFQQQPTTYSPQQLPHYPL